MDEEPPAAPAASGAAEAARSCGGCALFSACVLLPPLAQPIAERVGPKFVGPLLWLGLCVGLLALWLRLADSAMHGLAWGAIYITVLILLGVQILLALAALAGHAFA